MRDLKALNWPKILFIGEAPSKIEDAYQGEGELPPIKGIYKQMSIANAALRVSARPASEALAGVLDLFVAIVWSMFKVAEHRKFKLDKHMGWGARCCVRLGWAMIAPAKPLLDLIDSDKVVSDASRRSFDRFVGRVLLLVGPLILAYGLVFFCSLYWTGCFASLLFLLFESFLTHLRNEHADPHASHSAPPPNPVEAQS